MLYLIEGSDGLGKTTLAKALQWKVRCAYVHHTPPLDWRYEDFLTVLANAVYDRFHWSMWAYQTVNSQPLQLNVDDCLAIDERLSLILDGDYAPVCLYSSDPGYFDKMPVDHMFSAEQIKEVNARYVSVLKHFAVTIDVAVTGYPSPEQILDSTGF